MSNLVKYLGITLLAALLAACDGQKEDATGAVTPDKPAVEAPAGQNVSLLSGKVTFVLPADMHDQSGKLGTQANNMHVFANDNGQRAAIVIIGDNTTETLPVLAQRHEDQQRTRDTNLQVVTNKPIEVDGQTLHQLDSIVTSGGKLAYSSIILGKVDDHLLTLQITLPADNQQAAQTEAENIIRSLSLK